MTAPDREAIERVRKDHRLAKQLCTLTVEIETDGLSALLSALDRKDEAIKELVEALERWEEVASSHPVTTPPARARAYTLLCDALKEERNV